MLQINVIGTVRGFTQTQAFGRFRCSSRRYAIDAKCLQFHLLFLRKNRSVTHTSQDFQYIWITKHNLLTLRAIALFPHLLPEIFLINRPYEKNRLLKIPSKI